MRTLAGAFVVALICRSLPAQKIEVHWDQVLQPSATVPTLQVVVNPPLRRGSPIHAQVFSELAQLGADYVRYVPWLPYPRLGVAELEPPSGSTFWDFSLIDPLTLDFLEATKGHPVILNFSTIPAWMFRTPKQVMAPQDPDQVDWNYTQGTDLRDPSMKELGDYYARLVSWYRNGGFRDEYGQEHRSGHHYKIPYWEVLNESDFEHNMTPQQYTERYDAIAAAIHQVSPDTKFVALALAAPSKAPAMFEYFLDPRHHKPGVPLDMISYHFYATPDASQTPEIQQYTFFEQADGFLNSVRYIESIRKRLSPGTKTTVDEIGSISADDGEQSKPGHVTKPIPPSYWNLSGATYAYVYGNLAALGIEVAGESQLVGYPTQYPSVSMVDWNTGAPNARFRVLQLLKEELGPAYRVVKTERHVPGVFAQGFVGPGDEHKLLLVNKRGQNASVEVPAARSMKFVDVETAAQASAQRSLDGGGVQLGGCGVAVVRLGL